MTRKHFKLIAAALAATRPDDSPVNARLRYQWVYTRNMVAEACAQSNPDFNLSKFYQATEE